MNDQSEPGEPSEGQEFSKREQEVLSAVLDLMVERGEAFSMAAVAQRASCSKETLYRWFGDRDGLLTATVRWQAAKVTMPEISEGNLGLETFRMSLQAFAESWLTVITGDVSIALNRLAVSRSRANQDSLGRIVLENGPFAMRERLRPIFELGRQAGFLQVEPEMAFRSFFGLVIADTQIRALLGEPERPEKQEIEKLAETATAQFLNLYCIENKKITRQTGV